MQRTFRDDKFGNLIDEIGTAVGTINYGTGQISFDPNQVLHVPFGQYDVAYVGSGPAGDVYRNVFLGYSYVAAGAELDSNYPVVVQYRSNTSANNGNETLTGSNVAFDITAQYNENVVPGSVCFSLGGKTYFDKLGAIYKDLDVTTGAATLAGSINYQTGLVTLTSWVPGQPNTPGVSSLLTTLDDTPIEEVVFRIPMSPIRPGSLQLLATKLTGGLINVTADTSGNLTAPGVTGTIDYDTGVVRARFGAWVTAAGNENEIWYDAAAVRADGKIFKPAPVFADTVKYNAVAYSYLPLDASLIGIDPVRLPQDGQVPIFRKGSFAVIGHTKTSSPVTVSNGQTINLTRVRLSRVRVIGQNGNVINTGYTTNLEAGTVTFNDVTGYSQPITIEDRIEDMMQVNDVQINGDLTFTRQVTHDYPTGSVVSSALIAGDLHARVENMFDQSTWANVWADAVVGNAASGTYNKVLAPIVVTNEGAVTERWALVFTNATTFTIMGEHVGVIGTSNTTTDIAPLNPATNKPYFTLDAVGWGAGWAVGNVLRFNTVGAMFPVWVVRTVQQGAETVSSDSFTLLVRGDVDAA